MPTYPFRSKARFTCDRSSARTSDCSVHEQRGHDGHTGHVHAAEWRHEYERNEARDGNHVHQSRNCQRRRHAEPHRNRSKPVRAIEIEVLASVEHVEAANPGADGGGEKPGLPAGAPANGQPASNRRHRHCQPEEQLGPGCVPLCQRVPKDDGERHRRQRETQRVQLPRGKDEQDRRHGHKGDRLRPAHDTARKLAARGPRVEGIETRINQAIEAHRRAAGGHHRDEDPSDSPPGRRNVLCSQQRPGEREREREH